MMNEGSFAASALPRDTPENTVDVWTISLQALPETYEDSLKILSPDETARANGFRYARDQARYVLAHLGLGGFSQHTFRPICGGLNL
jgi:hypothetical protein